MDYIVHGILQVRILGWIAFPFSRGSFQPRYWTQVYHFAGGLFSSWATREAHWTMYNDMYLLYSIIQASFTGLNFPYGPHIQPFLPYNPWQSLIFLLSLWFYFFQNVILLESTVYSLFIVVSFTYWHAFKVPLCLLWHDSSLLFYHWIILYSIDIPQFIICILYTTDILKGILVVSKFWNLWIRLL